MIGKWMAAVLNELKAINHTLSSIHDQQIRIREELEVVQSQINEIQSTLDIEISPSLATIRDVALDEEKQS